MATKICWRLCLFTDAPFNAVKSKWLIGGIHERGTASAKLGQPLHCPVCNRRAFETHKFMLSYGLGQVFDFHALREQGLNVNMYCSHIQYFARHSLAELEPGSD